MRIDVILVVALYELVTIVGVGYYLARKARQRKDGPDQSTFALGGRSLGTWAIGTTLCLTLLGSGHLTGTFEGSLYQGAAQIWHVMANGFAMALGAYTIYLWARRMRITTTGEIVTRLYGEYLAVIIAAVNIAIGWAVCSFETQALGIIINSMTGWNLHLSVLIGIVIGFGYVVFGGTKQVAILNMINVVILYFGMFAALYYIAIQLPDVNFETVKAQYLNRPDFLKFTGGKEHFLHFGIPVLIAPFFAHSTGQQTIQTAASAKSEKALKRTVLFVGPMNVIIGAISIVLALTARSMPEFAHLDDKTVTTAMLVGMLPNWLIGIVFAAFVAALLSSYGGFLIGPSTVIAVDFVKSLYKPDMTDKQETRYIRVALFFGAIICGIMALTLPTIVVMFTWIYSFMIPAWFLFVFGLWWKRDLRVGLVAFVGSWLLANIWTFCPSIPEALGLGFHIAYVVTIFSFLSMLVGNLLVKGKPGYFKSPEWLNSEEYRIYLEEKKAGNA